MFLYTYIILLTTSTEIDAATEKTINELIRHQQLTSSNTKEKHSVYAA